MHYLIVILDTESAEILHGKALPNAGTAALLKTLSRLGLKLDPVDPSGESTNLKNYFSAAVTDLATAEEIVTQLSGLEIVENVFLEPGVEDPSEF